MTYEQALALAPSLGRNDVRKVETNIFVTRYGFRVWVSTFDKAGHSKRNSQIFPFDTPLEELRVSRDAGRREGQSLKPLVPVTVGGFIRDARTYLADPEVKTLLAYATREYEIEKWIEIFGARDRVTITDTDIKAELYCLRDGKYGRKFSGSSVNKFRTALMALYTHLDGPGAANPVKATPMLAESDVKPRHLSYDVLLRILDNIPEERGLSLDRSALYEAIWKAPVAAVAKDFRVSDSHLSRECRRLKVPTPPRGYWQKPLSQRPARPKLPLMAVGALRAPKPGLSRVRLEVMLWTGMDPAEIKRLTPDHVNLDEGWYTLPPRRKGGKRAQRRRAIADLTEVQMTRESRAAFERFVAADAWGDFSTSSLRKAWMRGCEAAKVPVSTPKQIRHSFATAVRRAKKAGAAEVGSLLGHAPGSRETRTYTIGAEGDIKSADAAIVSALHGRKGKR